MEFFHGTSFDFIGKRRWYIAFTAILTVMSCWAFYEHRGPILGLEFTGGTLVQIGFKQQLPPIDQVRHDLDQEGWKGVGLQSQPSNNTLIVRVKGDQKPKDDLAYDLIRGLKKYYPNSVKDIADRVEFIGPVVGESLRMNTYKAIFGSLLVICIYVAFRFKNWIWGVSGVLALGHDVFMAWGILTFLGRETTLVVIAALLTLAGYSINDTIVVFDRVRENLRTARKESNHDLYNRSLNETLGRTVNTAMTTFLASLALYFFGGEVIHDFSFVMAFGTVIGCYSSVGIALALVYEIEERRRKAR